MLDAEGVAFGSRYNLALSRIDKAHAVGDVKGRTAPSSTTSSSVGDDKHLPSCFVRVFRVAMHNAISQPISRNPEAPATSSKLHRYKYHSITCTPLIYRLPMTSNQWSKPIGRLKPAVDWSCNAQIWKPRERQTHRGRDGVWKN